jgi:hypothetical protein
MPMGEAKGRKKYERKKEKLHSTVSAFPISY